MPINPNANRNAITQTLMNIQNPPPRQLPPQGARGGPAEAIVGGRCCGCMPWAPPWGGSCRGGGF